jgi:hypothetical protein
LEHYITLFDSGFLPQGLALYRSLVRHAGPFKLWILCIDTDVQATLAKLALPHMETIALADVETPELLRVKPGRNRAEYCWTLTPFTPPLVFERAPEAARVTYIDADMFLLQSPQPIFREFEASGKSVMITDHAYAPEYDQSAVSGQYCVQFMIFARGASEPVRQWWQDRCIEWCFDRKEDGKCGDQKYLDDWPTRFGEQVHVLQQLDVLLAPWNARRFPYSRAIAWHFHSLRLLPRQRVLLHAPYFVPDIVHEMIYAPYVAELKISMDLVGRQIVQKHTHRPLLASFKTFVRNLRRLIRDLRNHDAVRTLPE